MPTIPLYNQQVQPALSGAAIPRMQQGEYFSNVIGIGNLMARRGEQLLQEYDSTVAYDAFTELRNNTREKLNDLLTREGASAIGVQKEYNEWERGIRDKISTQITTVPRQRDLFWKIADRHKENDLDRLAGHEARQIDTYKKTKLSALAQVFENESMANAFDDRVLENIIGEYSQAEAELYPNRLPEERALGIIKARNQFRTAAMLELMDKNPAVASQKLEEWKDELGDKYYPLKKQLEHNTKEKQMTTAYETLKRATNNNPYAALQTLNSVDWTSRNKLDAQVVERLKNVFEGEIRWNKFLVDEGRREKSIQVMTSINQMLAQGDIQGAERIYAASDFLNPFDANQIRNVLDARISRFTDSGLFQKIKAGIKSNDITAPSQIEMWEGRGLSKQDTGLLKQELKDNRDDPTRAQGIEEAMKWYDREFNTTGQRPDINFVKMRAKVEGWLRDHVQEENIKGAQKILDELIKYTGTKEDVKYKFSFWPPSIQKTSNAPMGMAMDQDKSMREYKRSNQPEAGGTPIPKIRTAEDAMAEQVPTSDSIPADVREKIGHILDAAGKPKTEKNYRMFYDKNKDRLLK